MKIQDLQNHLKNQNVRAFLRAIRLGEGTKDDAGYYRIVGGRSFDDDSKHPAVRVFIQKYNVWSTAAGAYQIILPTWKKLQSQYGFYDFSPSSQDMAAVALIAGRGALDDVIAGNLRDAVTKCAEEWASLPGSKAGQRTENYASVEQEFINYNGVIS